VDSWRFLISRRWLLFALAVAAFVAGSAWLGDWQFDRLADRKADNGIVASNETLPPAPVEEVLAVGQPARAEDEWRLVSATGTYAADDSVVVRYRTRDGASGVDVVVPLVTDSGTALLVDRGWLATNPNGQDRGDIPAPPTGRLSVTGWVRGDGTGASTTVDDRSTRAISSVRIGAALDREVYGGFIELRDEDGAPAEGLAAVELPDLGNGPHFFYGLQWWFFGIFGVAGFIYLAFDERRGGRGISGRKVTDRGRARHPQEA
jgi:cytochrome oxidase assembly protein ShyY1